MIGATGVGKRKLPVGSQKLADAPFVKEKLPNLQK